jgi:hypothetical protein
VSLVASTDPSRGRSQCSLLVNVGTTFRTDKTHSTTLVRISILDFLSSKSLFQPYMCVYIYMIPYNLPFNLVGLVD